MSADVVRAVWEWINTFPFFPENVQMVETEFLGRGDCLSLSVENAPVIVSRFISGAFTAQLKFGVRFRTAPGCSRQRIDAMKFLDCLADWLQNGLPPLGSQMRALAVEKSAPVILEEREENGSEIYLVRFVLTYQALSHSI
ncbi:MAG: hypothetical protein K2O18_02185 [Oscillospiraceae bacterium]|nr:hypothetical protein [Oscillospiraceae bacterium]